MTPTQPLILAKELGIAQGNYWACCTGAAAQTDKQAEKAMQISILTETTFDKHYIDMEDAFGPLIISHDKRVEAENADVSIAADSQPSVPQTTIHGCLDGLPTELKALILQDIPNTPTLQALVKSSPLYYGAYLSQRQLILSTILLRDIGAEVLADALAVQDACVIPFGDSRKRRESLSRCLLQYKYHLAVKWTEMPDVYTLAPMARLQSIIVDMTSDFCESTLSLCPVTDKWLSNHEPPSQNEKRRIYRAFYRYELFHALFDEPLGAPIPAECRGLLDSMDRNVLFLSIFKTWEVEELACVRDYMTRRYTEILKQCSYELSQLHPAKDFSPDEFWQVHNVEYLLTLGLTFLWRLMRAPSTREKCCILEGNLWGNVSFLTTTLKEEPYDFMYPTEANTAYEDEEELQFRGDHVVDGPNAAWPWSTNYKAEVWYFQREKQNLRSWAYVMWDYDRLERCKVLDMYVPEISMLTGY